MAIVFIKPKAREDITDPFQDYPHLTSCLLVIVLWPDFLSLRLSPRENPHMIPLPDNLVLTLAHVVQIKSVIRSPIFRLAARKLADEL